jgi:hypothetical protein
MENRPKVLPLETPNGGVEHVRRPNFWNEGTAKGFVRGCLIAAACAAVAMVAPYALLGSLLNVAGVIACLRSTYQGAIEGADAMGVKYKEALRQAAISYEQQPDIGIMSGPAQAIKRELDYSNSGINYRTNHAAQLQSGGARRGMANNL